MMIGIDIGRQRDPSAIAVADGLALRHLERVPLGTPYPQLVDHIVGLARLLPEHGLAVDATGVGRAVIDMLRAQEIVVLAVTITGGRRVIATGDEVSVPRKALFLPLVAGIENGRVKIATGLPHGPALIDEIKTARRHGERVEGRGAGHHGDLMTAAALALWAQGLARLEARRGARQESIHVR